MEDVCNFIENNWNFDYDCECIEQTNDDLIKINYTDKVNDYIITQLNIFIGDKITEIVSHEENSSVSFKYKNKYITIKDLWFKSRYYGFWVIYFN
jgi:hypothetical protein